jgi:hypothetical protein
MSTEVILINLGNHQPYILFNIQQLRLFNYNITVITDLSLKHHFIHLRDINLITTDSLCIKYIFDNRTQLDVDFRDGFWTFTSKRLFYLYAYLKKYNVQNVLHLENDVLLYKDLIIPDKNFVWLTMDSSDRCIPGILFIPNHCLMEPLITHYEFHVNDMQNCASFFYHYNHICKSFPIIRENSHYPTIDAYNTHFNEFNAIFDAAAMGQFLGGVDPRNIEGDSRGFVNQECLVNYSHYSFFWVQNKNNLFIPHILIDSSLIPIVNLHIHSKQLHHFMSSQPIENKCITFVPDLQQKHIITGEFLQQSADIYCGTLPDFEYNPVIFKQPHKWLDLTRICKPFDNPRRIFCYSHQLHLFQSKLHFFQNPFVFISHNSDHNITAEFRDLVQSDKIVQWYCQNPTFSHPKLHLLPIGIANSMWQHGNLSLLMDVMEKPFHKTNDFYLQFSVSTNYNERTTCKTILEGKGIPFLPSHDYPNYLKTLSSYKFAFCPEGNGLDSHRIWECFYLNVIPILVRSDFSTILSMHFPCIMLDDWNQFDYSVINAYPACLKQLYSVRHKLMNNFYI